MKLAPFVALRPALSILRLTGAKLTKILCSLGSEVGEKLHLDSSQGLAYMGEMLIRMRTARTRSANCFFPSPAHDAIECTALG